MEHIIWKIWKGRSYEGHGIRNILKDISFKDDVTVIFHYYVLCISYCNKGILGIIHSRLSTKPTRLQRKCLGTETLEISVSRPSRNLSLETFSRSQFRDLLEISVSRPSRDLSSEAFSKSHFRDLLEISISRPSRDLSSETSSKSQSRDLLEISISRPSRDLSSETFSKSQSRDLLEISVPRPPRNLSPETS
jgi:hypothetical protein